MLAPFSRLIFYSVHMRILYIHGLDSSPNPDRIQSLEEAGHQVFALHLDYRQQPDAYAILRAYAQQNHLDFIIGSSLGGVLGFWLAEEMGVPCLLFNPAVYLSRSEIHIELTARRGCSLRWVVIGEQDEVVDPEESWRFFQQPDQQQARQRVIRCQWLGHQIDRATFREMQRWAGLG
jgi:uncharacterized protein